MKRLDLPIIATVEAEGALFAHQNRNRFHRVLLDAPCSNTGVLRRRVEARWRFSSQSLVDLVKQQRELLDAVVLRPVEIVVAPHHGSRSSSTADFTTATAPRWVVFTAGHRNRWGFPAPRVVTRWRDAGARTLETSATGSIEFEVRPGEPLAAPGRWRVDHHRFWQDP